MSALNRKIKQILAEGGQQSRVAARIEELVREKQAEALEEFAEKWATADGMEAIMFATNAEEAVMATERELLACAAEYRKGEGGESRGER